MNSIKNQTLQPYEVLIIDDCSSDTYDDILKDYDNIRYIRLEKNKGVGAVRRKIVDECKTKYLTMIDSDDKLYNDDVIHTFNDLLLKLNPDILNTCYYQENYDGTYLKILTMANCLGKVYNIDFMRKHNINFCDARTHEEGFVNRYIENYGKVFSTPEYVSYIWRCHNISITRGNDYTYTGFEDYINSIKKSYLVVKDINYRSEMIIYAHSYFEQIRLKYKCERKEFLNLLKYVSFDELLDFKKNNLDRYNFILNDVKNNTYNLKLMEDIFKYKERIII